jgi:hypothetical protein
MSDILRDDDDPSSQFEGIQDLLPSPSHSNHHDSLEELEPTDESNLFGARPTDYDAAHDTIMNDQSTALIPEVEPTIDQVCSNLQLKLKLDPEHLKIALSTIKVRFNLIHYYCC